MKIARFSLTLFMFLAALCGKAAAADAQTLGPVETLQSIQKALSADPPQVQIFWTSLPETYQKEIRGLITTFADNTDPELWNASFSLIKKAAKVADDQSEYIQKSDAVAKLSGGPGGAKKAEFLTQPEHWEAVVSIVETIATSKISTHDGLKNIDPEKFLATTGTKVAGKCIDLALAAGGDDAARAKKEWEQFQGGKFTLVSEDGNSATVKFEVEGRDASEIRLTKVDGKWVFAELASDFEKSIAEAKAAVGQLQVVAQEKDQFLKVAAVIEAGLDELLEAESQADFDKAGEQLAQKVVGVFLAGAPAATEANPTSSPAQPTDESNENE